MLQAFQSGMLVNDFSAQMKQFQGDFFIMKGLFELINMMDTVAQFLMHSCLGLCLASKCA